jgi:hypothetical protein
MNSTDAIKGLLVVVAIAALAIVLAVRYPRVRWPLGVLALIAIAASFVLPIHDRRASTLRELERGARVSVSIHSTEENRRSMLQRLTGDGVRVIDEQQDLRAPRETAKGPRSEAPRPVQASTAATEHRLSSVRDRRPKVAFAKALIEAIDDQALWTTGLPEDPLGFAPLALGSQRPSWVEDAAGAQIVAESFGGALVSFWQPGPEQRLVAYSGPEATPELAIDAAIAIATEKLAVLALRDLARKGRVEVVEVAPFAARLVTSPIRVEDYLERGSLDMSVLPNRAELVSETTTDMSDGRSSRVTSGIDVFRAAVLFEATSSEISRRSAEIQAALEAGRLRDQRVSRTFIGRIFGTAILAFAVFLIYSLTNAGTKGHFAVPLRLLSSLVLLGGAAWIWYLSAGLGWFR